MERCLLFFLYSYFLETSKNNFDKYIYTIDQLLKLRDDELSYFIMSNDESNLSSSYELYEWQFQIKLLVVKSHIISQS